MLPFLSVIVPIYGVEQYLHECVDSIIEQTFKDIEIILGIALSVFTGLFGNYLYMKKVNKNVEMMKNMNEDQKYYHCISKGGTSGWMIFIYIIITFICEALLLSFFS